MILKHRLNTMQFFYNNALCLISLKPLFVPCHSGLDPESICRCHRANLKATWIPAFAGMTKYGNPIIIEFPGYALQLGLFRVLNTEF